MLNFPRAVSQMVFAAVKKLVQKCSTSWQLGLGVESTHAWLAEQSWFPSCNMEALWTY